MRQRTIDVGSLTFQSIGIHTGRQFTMTIYPAPADNGIQFYHYGAGTTDIIPATVDGLWGDPYGRTLLGQGSKNISTVEHLMATLYALGIDNVNITVTDTSNPTARELEVPILDGSALPFYTELAKHVKHLDIPRRTVAITEDHEVTRHSDHYSRIDVHPFDGFMIDVTCDNYSWTGPQRVTIRLDEDGHEFGRELAPARTFGLVSDMDKLYAKRLALGASPVNTMIVNKTKTGYILPPNITEPDFEMVTCPMARHKALDLIGDIALGLPGCRPKCLIRAINPNHRLNIQMARELFRAYITNSTDKGQ